MTVRIFCLLSLTSWLALANAEPTDYRFVSVYRELSPIGQFAIAGGAINNNGTIAIGLRPSGSDFQNVYRADGLVWTQVWQAADTGDAFNVLDINDVDVVAGVLGICCAGDRELTRVAADGTPTTLATRIVGCGGPDDFCGFNQVLGGLNDAGQVVIKASFDHGAGAADGIWLFGDGAPVEIERTDTVNTGGLFNLTDPSLNNIGVIAFGATEVDDPGSHVYTTSGGPVTQEGTVPMPFGGGITQALINESGVIGARANGIHVLDNGVVTTVLAAQFGISGPANLSCNNNDQLAFEGCIGAVCGIFTGSDPVADSVLRNGDPLFDGTVTAGGVTAFAFGARNLNDKAEITFKVQIDVDAQIESHLVRAIPLSPAYDSDDDGVANDLDNCLITPNPLQSDSNGDGFGTHCDADLNGDGIVNIADLGVFKLAFFTTDADADFNVDGIVNAVDLGILKLRFFVPPGPSALAE